MGLGLELGLGLGLGVGLLPSPGNHRTSSATELPASCLSGTSKLRPG